MTFTFNQALFMTALAPSMMIASPQTRSFSLPSSAMTKVISEEFDHYMELLVFLKDPRTKPIISKLNPKMCLTCWQIFSDREKADHLQSGGPGPSEIKHKITGTFQSMQAAKKESILGLSRQWQKTKGVIGSQDEIVQLLTLSKSLADLISDDGSKPSTQTKTPESKAIQ